MTVTYQVSYCANCRRVTGTKLESRPRDRAVETCLVCHRSWPTGKKPR